MDTVESDPFIFLGQAEFVNFVKQSHYIENNIKQLWHSSVTAESMAPLSLIRSVNDYAELA